MLERRVIFTEIGQRRVVERGALNQYEGRAGRPEVYLLTLGAALAGVTLVSGTLLLMQLASTKDSSVDHSTAVVQQVKPQSIKSSLQIGEARGTNRWFRSASSAVAQVEYTASISSQSRAPAVVTAYSEPQALRPSAPSYGEAVERPDESGPEIAGVPQQEKLSDEPLLSEVASAQEWATPVPGKNEVEAGGGTSSQTTDATLKTNSDASSEDAPPLPKRKDYGYVRQIAAAPKVEKVAPASRPSSQQRPMALAPSDTITPPKRLSLSAYSGKVFGAVARHKPRIGRQGSAKVAFGIGAGGQLAFVRVVGSSGDKSLDRLAVATVRKSAPFPRPPAGPVSYSIRIHFR